ncbi:MAG: L,D-transpeptidase family protein [Gammaproteobacteria bacterium]
MSNRLRLFMQWTVLAILFLLMMTNASLADTLFQPMYNSSLAKPQPEHIASSLADKNLNELRYALANYQNAESHPWPMVPETHKLLKVGSKNSTVAILRERLLITNDLPTAFNRNDNLFDRPLGQAVRVFQARHGLKADGVVGTNTLRELNITPAERAKQIEVNMRRWAELSDKLTDRFVMVNIPEYELYVYENNEKVFSMKTIVGKITNQTPELQSSILRIVFNPYWNIPETIARKEIVKKVAENPGYLDENRIRIFESQENNAIEMNQEDVNWQRSDARTFPYFLRQEPGEDNSLGVIKFEFQNSQDVYLHDTPAKELFNEDTRALSHGCVRLENPVALVDYLMKTNPEWDEDRMQSILDTGKTTYVRVPQSLPIFITYITAWIDENGAVNFRDDVYGKDQ